MRSTVITIDIKTKGSLNNDFTGSLFRGWLGFILKCHPERSCNECIETQSCPYFMVFKEKTDIKPYSILSFKNGEFIRNFIKIYGDRIKLVPRILSDINNKAASLHFSGLRYTIESLEAKNIELLKDDLTKNTTVVFVSPINLLKDRRTEVIPSFESLLAASVRSFNRITKYYGQDDYPFRASDDLFSYEIPIQDFNIRTVKYVHKKMDNASIVLTGSMGWVKYDTSKVKAEAGEILKMGEALQIGKHTTYGLGGFLINKKA